jgi:hypothetical protein
MNCKDVRENLHEMDYCLFKMEALIVNGSLITRVGCKTDRIVVKY